MKYIPRMTRSERKEEKKQMRDDAMHGEGKYIYENSTSGDLKLPKPLPGGRIWIRKGQQFEGDSYYLQLVRAHMLRLIQAVPEKKEEQVMNESEEKLILDQPDRYTTEGKTEQVKKKKTFPFQESKDKKTSEKALIVEDPVGSMEIISD